MPGTEPIEIAHDGARLRGVLVRPMGDGPAGEGPFPTVLVLHSGVGLYDFYRDKAVELAALGYLAVAPNLFDASVDLTRPDSYGAAYMGLMENPAQLRARLAAWLAVVAARAEVDAARIAAIGYCFGGHCALELARSGADLRAFVSYHGTLKTSAPATPGTVRGHVAAYCGAEDPYAPMDDVIALRQELEAAGAAYSLQVFGGVAHSFTDPHADRHDHPGIRYDPLAAKLSWTGTLALLEEVLA